MKATTKILFYILLTFLVNDPLFIFSQKVISADGNSEVRLESNMTKDWAREKAEELAKINAIESVFGTVIEGVTDIRIKDGHVNFDMIGGTKVLGEWIRTNELIINEETRIIEGKHGREQEIWIICKINGEVRKCASRANIDFSTLNCPMISCRQTAFFNEESLFLYFKSPVDGYLSVFLDDGENTFRLLPYKSMGTLSAVKIKGDTDYIFFSKDKDHEYDVQYTTDALELFTDKEIEYNNLYVVFAESPYVKPILNEVTEVEGGYFMPKSLKTEDFEDWLSDCRAAVTDYQSVRVRINIEKR